MQDFVSTRWIRVAGLVASMSLLWASSIPSGLGWMTVGLSLAFFGALWLRVRSPRSIAQLIDDVDAEPVRAVATPVRVAARVPKVVL